MNIEDFRRYRATGDKRIRNRLVLDNMGIVKRVVYQGGACPLEDRDDLIQAGTIGLMTALDRFDPAKGGFYTYAKLWVIYHVQIAIRQRNGSSARMDRLPARASAGRVASALGASAIGVMRPADGAVQADARHDLGRVLRSFTPREITALLAHADGATESEICALLGAPRREGAATLAALLLRARDTRETP